MFSKSVNGKSQMSKRLTKKKIILLVIMVCVVGLWILLRPGEVDVEAAIAEFEAKPSQASADVLVRLIDNQMVTAEDGERILKLLFQPKITKKSTYPVGEPVFISIERPFIDVSFKKSILQCSQTVTSGKYIRNNGNIAWDSPANLNSTARLILLPGPTPKSAGSYKLNIEYEFFTARSIRPLWWSLLLYRFRGGGVGGVMVQYESSYNCRVTVPVEIIVKEKTEDSR